MKTHLNFFHKLDSVGSGLIKKIVQFSKRSSTIQGYKTLFSFLYNHKRKRGLPDPEQSNRI